MNYGNLFLNMLRMLLMSFSFLVISALASHPSAESRVRYLCRYSGSSLRCPLLSPERAIRINSQGTYFRKSRFCDKLFWSISISATNFAWILGLSWSSMSSDLYSTHGNLILNLLKQFEILSASSRNGSSFLNSPDV